jgi:copper chaperone NosL
MRGKLIYITTLIVSLALLSACEPEPQPIQYGGDQCEYCRMMITDPEFGSQVLNKQGRSFKFDSVECMAAFDLTFDDPDNIHSRWVPDFLDRDTWLNAESAFYLHSETLRSPMGLYLSAYENRASAEQMRDEYGGEIIGYDQVKVIVENEWLSGNGQSQRMYQ